MTFLEFVDKNKNLNNPQGDFCKDWLNDLDKPNITKRSDKKLIEYLREKCACENAIRAAKTTWNEWRYL